MRVSPQHKSRQKGGALDASVKQFTFRECRCWENQNVSMSTLVICYSTRCTDVRVCPSGCCRKPDSSCSAEDAPPQITFHVKGLLAISYMRCNVICPSTSRTYLLHSLVYRTLLATPEPPKTLEERTCPKHAAATDVACSAPLP